MLKGILRGVVTFEDFAQIFKGYEVAQLGRCQAAQPATVKRRVDGILDSAVPLVIVPFHPSIPIHNQST